MPILSTAHTHLNRARRAGRAALVRAIAGQPLGAALSRPRRGTVLILILGALALISVITLIYTALGQSDRRASQTTRIRADVTGTVDKISDYFRDVIGDGVFATRVDGKTVRPGSANPVAVLVRSAADYPFTDPTRKSIIPGARPLPSGPSGIDYGFFSPTGSFSLPDVAAGADLRQPSTPFLASTDASWIITTPPGTTPPGMSLDNNWYERLDWQHITNLSPDGRFVNLANLRGNFDAKSAFTPGGGSGNPMAVAPDDLSTLSDSNGKPTLSYGLTLLKPGMPALPAVFEPTFHLEQGNGPIADVNTPAQWSDRQFGLNMPAAGPAFYGNAVHNAIDPDPTVTPNSPGSFLYPPYQFADADGDGFFDSRWFELVNASDPNNPLSLLPNDGRFRWFIAARVMDLSALVNVNTATDFQWAPRAEKDSLGATLPTQEIGVLPMGLSPSDVDLRRVLTLDDVNHQFGFAYDALYRPTSIQTTSEDYGGYTPSVAQGVGDAAYGALRAVLRNNSSEVPPQGQALTGSWAPRLLGDTLDADIAKEHFDQRVFYYQRFGGQPDAHYTKIGGPVSAPGFELSGRFGVSELQELLAYEGLNNPHTTSRLEQTLDGRLIQYTSFGPLRSNRGLELERAADLAEHQGLGDGGADDAAPPPANPTLLATPLHRMAADVRHLITPISLTRPLVSSIISTGTPPQMGPGQEPLYLNQLDPNTDLRLDARKALGDASLNMTTGALGDPTDLYRAFVRALVPQVGRADIWKDPATSALAPLTYGYREMNDALHNPNSLPTPPLELALRIAGFMTANAIDAYDKFDGSHLNVGRPRAFTQVLHQSATPNNTMDFPWWNETGGKLDLTDGQGNSLLPAAIDPTSTAGNNGAVNIYGIEAQPFLVQAAAMALYTDSPRTDDDNNGWNPGDPTDPPELTLDATGQYDFLGEFLAFKLTNPFNVPIQLTSPTDPNRPSQSLGGDTGEYSEFYIEYAGLYYKLEGVADNSTGQPAYRTLVLSPGETRVFVAPSMPVDQMQMRWESSIAPGAYTISPTAVINFVNDQFAIDETPGVPVGSDVIVGPNGRRRVKPVVISCMDPTSGGLQTMLPRLHMVNGGSADSKKAVHLWRVMRSASDATGVNMRDNDLLVDRLRDPNAVSPGSGPAVLERTLRDGNLRITNTIAGPQETGTGGHSLQAFDNTGLVVALCGSIRRNDDPRPGGNVPKGGVPAFCLEAKWKGSSNLLHNAKELGSINGEAQITNTQSEHSFHLFYTGNAPNAMNPSDRRPHLRHNAEQDLGLFVSKFANLTSSDFTLLLESMTINPSRGSTANIGGSGPSMMPSNEDGKAYFDSSTKNNLYAQVHLDDYEYMAMAHPLTGGTQKVSVLRVVDMLTPLGIGPMYDPGASSSDDPDDVDAVQGVAGTNYAGRLTLSEALALAMDYSNPPLNMGRFQDFYKIGDPQSGALDRGHLVLDRFAPYEKVGNVNVPRFPYIPLALHVLDVFTSTDSQYGGLAKGTPGMVNLNTAPVEVMRCLPFLSPTTEPDTSGNANGLWMGLVKQMNASGASPPISLPQPPSGAMPPDGTDIAPTIVAVRDRTSMPDRDKQMIWFGDANPLTAAFNPANWNGRYNTTGIPGISESPGFPSPAAVLTAIHRVSITGTGVSPGTSLVPMRDQIDYLGNEGQYMAGTAQNSTVAALSSTVYPSYADTGAASHKPSEVPDSWFEKLEIASALGGSTSVRSDTFAVWFVVHGYQRSDVENLGPNDPLVPTIAKRFLMVLDRSNVVKKGDRPRVVLFTELPMN